MMKLKTICCAIDVRFFSA